LQNCPKIDKIEDFCFYQKEFHHQYLPKRAVRLGLEIIFKTLFFHLDKFAKTSLPPPPISKMSKKYMISYSDCHKFLDLAPS
jgi:hypothetical protein